MLFSSVCYEKAALPDALTDAPGSLFRSQRADGCVVGAQDVTAQGRCLDLVDHGLQDPHRVATPIGKHAARNIGAHTRENLVLAVQRQMIVELGDQHIGEEARAGHAAGDRAAATRKLAVRTWARTSLSGFHCSSTSGQETLAARRESTFSEEECSRNVVRFNYRHEFSGERTNWFHWHRAKDCR